MSFEGAVRSRLLALLNHVGKCLLDLFFLVIDVLEDVEVQIFHGLDVLVNGTLRKGTLEGNFKRQKRLRWLSARPGPWRRPMHGIIYLVGLIVVVLAILSF